MSGRGVDCLSLFNKSQLVHKLVESIVKLTLKIDKVASEYTERHNDTNSERHERR